MLEYVLFSEQIRDIFIAWLQDNHIEFQLTGCDEELLVLINEDIDHLTEKKIEEQYDLLLDVNVRAIDAEDDLPDSVHLVTIQYKNKNGEIGQVQITPKLANKIQQCLTTVELQAFVQLIADEIIDPKNKALCHH